ncbi:MAG: hypothetical protein ACJ796_14300 [Gemmatimonadaceae bacterium]
MQVELDYNDPSRAVTLSAVVDFCMKLVGDRAKDEELTALEEWAVSALPSDYQQLRIPGFGPAGFQYLRMLFGANTTKPDTHIRQYVTEALNRSVGDLESVSLLEAACRRLGILARDADTNIWEARAR